MVVNEQTGQACNVGKVVVYGERDVDAVRAAMYGERDVDVVWAAKLAH